MYTLICIEICCCTLCISLHRGCNLTLVSTVCEAAPISLFRALNGLAVIGLQIMAPTVVFKSRYSREGQEQGFQPCFADRLNHKSSSICCTGYPCMLLHNVVVYNAKIKQNALFSHSISCHTDQHSQCKKTL